MRARGRVLIVSVLALVASSIATFFWLEQSLHAAGPLAAEQRFVVRPGESARSVLQRLQEAGALAHPRLTEVWWRLRQGPLDIKAGRYLLAERVSASALVKQLVEGRVLLESLTIVEGSTFAEFRRALRAHPEIKQTVADLTDAELMAALGAVGHPEGRFFPDTYRFAAGTRDLDILRLGYDKMAEQLQQAWTHRRGDLPLRSAEEVLILASIVEKETGLASERARVAGVFISRLRRGMRLQSDPTIIYGLGDSFDGDIRTRDLRTDTPYNTYTRNGLPPTPISLPGAEALRAVVQPEETGELFFVATGEGDGSHRFSRTYAEHRAAVAAMLARQRALRAERSTERAARSATRPLSAAP